MIVLKRPQRPAAPPTEDASGPGDATRTREVESSTEPSSTSSTSTTGQTSITSQTTTPSGDDAPSEPRGDDASSASRVAGALAIGATLALWISFPSLGVAQEIPDTATLDGLRERLTRQAPCGERCSEGNHMQITASAHVLRVRIDVSAANVAAYPLPGPSDVWTPSSVRVDGAPTSALVRLENGFLHVRVPSGAHVIELEGPVAGRDAVTLALGRPPRALDVATDGWEASGHVSDDRVAESIQLRRTLESEGGPAEQRSDLPAWLEVQRTIDVGVRWTVSTVVTRRSPANAPAVARVSLLPGERVTDSGVTVERGEVLVTLGQQDTEMRWTSVLEPSEAIALTAPETSAVNEVWVLVCSPLWHCTTPEGSLAPTTPGPAGVWQPTFHPWPGESLTISVSRPDAAEGQSLTVDSARLDVTPGIRLTTSTLSVSVRSSVSAPFAIELPAGTDVQPLTVDGQARPLQRDGDRISVALQPGHHDLQLAWQAGTGWSAVLETPRVALGNAAVNVELHVTLSSDRWILWLGGPAWGPAVLFWPYLALALVLALALSRRKDVPLEVHHWVLLLLGLTQVPAPAAIIVVVWFFLLSNRRTDLQVHDLYFAARQLVIVGYTFVAFLCLVWAVDGGLLGDPAMEIAGPMCSSSIVRFFVDRTSEALPTASVVSLPLWVYRVLMFAWALWLAVSLLRWTQWGWSAFEEGGLFRFPGRAPRAATPPAPDAGPTCASIKSMGARARLS